MISCESFFASDTPSNVVVVSHQILLLVFPQKKKDFTPRGCFKFVLTPNLNLLYLIKLIGKHNIYNTKFASLNRTSNVS